MPDHELKRIARALFVMPAAVTLIAASYAVHFGVSTAVACYGVLTRKRIRYHEQAGPAPDGGSDGATSAAAQPTVRYPLPRGELPMEGSPPR